MFILLQGSGASKVDGADVVIGTTPTLSNVDKFGASDTGFK
jgi:hypothetical protein